MSKFLGACQDGDLVQIKKLAGRVKKQKALDEAVTIAIHNGHLAVLRYLIEDAPGPIRQMAADAVREGGGVCEAAWCCDLRMVRYFVEEAPGFTSKAADVTARDNEAVRAAAECGSLDILRYFVEEVPKINGQKVDVTDRNNYAVRHAAGKGHFDIVRYLVEEVPKLTGQTVDIAAESNGAVREAERREEHDMLHYLERVPAIQMRIKRELQQLQFDRQQKEKQARFEAGIQGAALDMVNNFFD